MILTSEKISELKKRGVTTVKIKNQSNSIKKAVNSIGNDWYKIRIKNQWWDAEEKKCLAKKIKNGGRLVKEITSKKKKRLMINNFVRMMFLTISKSLLMRRKVLRKLINQTLVRRKLKI